IGSGSPSPHRRRLIDRPSSVVLAARQTGPSLPDATVQRLLAGRAGLDVLLDLPAEVGVQARVIAVQIAAELLGGRVLGHGRPSSQAESSSSVISRLSNLITLNLAW